MHKTEPFTKSVIWPPNANLTEVKKPWTGLMFAEDTVMYRSLSAASDASQGITEYMIKSASITTTEKSETLLSRSFSNIQISLMLGSHKLWPKS